MKKFILISPKNRTAYNFRGDLVKSIIKKGYDVIVTGPNMDGVEHITALGAHFEVVPMNKNGVNPISDIKYTWKLYKLMKSNKIEASLGYTIKPVIYGAIAARLAKVKSITSMVTGTGYLFTAKSIKSKVLKIVALMLYRMGFSCANTVIFQNQDDRNEFVENGLLKLNKTRVVNGSGVNMDHFVPTALPNRITFFMLSRALKSKGVREYLEACKIVKRQYPEVRCMYLGAVEKMQDALSWEDVESYIKDGIIEYFPETQDVRKFTGQCSVYVLPSYKEGTPRTVLEAMAMKRAVITTDVPGCRETVQPGVNGYLVEAKNPKAVADKMIYLIEHPELIPHMAEKSYEICKQKYEVGRVNHEMIEHMKLD